VSASSEQADRLIRTVVMAIIERRRRLLQVAPVLSVIPVMELAAMELALCLRRA
jgi:hypothetical protein